jgi:hypothetical protein
MNGDDAERVACPASSSSIYGYGAPMERDRVGRRGMWEELSPAAHNSFHDFEIRHRRTPSSIGTGVGALGVGGGFRDEPTVELWWGGIPMADG